MDETVSSMQLILGNCKDKIKKFNCLLDCDEQYKLSPLVLNNAVEIQTDHLYFPIFWSKKCEKMSFLWLKNVGTGWCNHIINNCIHTVV